MSIAKSVYEMVTDRIISQLEQNIIPWEKPWTGVKSGGHIRKGKKSEIVVFWKIQPIEEIKEDGTKEVKQIPIRCYWNPNATAL